MEETRCSRGNAKKIAVKTLKLSKVNITTYEPVGTVHNDCVLKYIWPLLLSMIDYGWLKVAYC